MFNLELELVDPLRAPERSELLPSRGAFRGLGFLRSKGKPKGSEGGEPEREAHADIRAFSSLSVFFSGSDGQRW